MKSASLSGSSDQQPIRCSLGSVGCAAIPVKAAESLPKRVVSSGLRGADGAAAAVSDAVAARVSAGTASVIVFSRLVGPAAMAALHVYRQFIPTTFACQAGP